MRAPVVVSTRLIFVGAVLYARADFGWRCMLGRNVLAGSRSGGGGLGGGPEGPSPDLGANPAAIDGATLGEGATGLGRMGGAGAPTVAALAPRGALRAWALCEPWPIIAVPIVGIACVLLAPPMPPMTRCISR